MLRPIVSAIVTAAIAASLAGLARLVPVPTGPLGYGVDLWCEDDLKPNADELGADSKLILGQAVFHRLTTPRGDLPDDLEYGRDVRALLSKGLTQSAIRAEASQLSTEVTKDDRIAECTVTVEQLTLKDLRITVICVAKDAAVGGFELVIAVDSEGAWLKAVT